MVYPFRFLPDFPFPRVLFLDLTMTRHWAAAGGTDGRITRSVSVDGTSSTTASAGAGGGSRGTDGGSKCSSEGADGVDGSRCYSRESPAADAETLEAPWQR